MRRRDWLLLAIGDFMEPIQVQKTMFLFAKRAGAPTTQQYQFKPYNWGPYAALIYADLGSLRAEGLIQLEPHPGGWSAYTTTPEGEQRAGEIRAEAPKALVKALDEQRAWVKSRSFRKLLSDVYKAYPEYAERSLFSG